MVIIIQSYSFTSCGVLAIGQQHPELTDRHRPCHQQLKTSGKKEHWESQITYAYKPVSKKNVEDNI